MNYEISFFCCTQLFFLLKIFSMTECEYWTRENCTLSQFHVYVKIVDLDLHSNHWVIFNEIWVCCERNIIKTMPRGGKRRNKLFLNFSTILVFGAFRIVLEGYWWKIPLGQNMYEFLLARRSRSDRHFLFEHSIKNHLKISKMHLKKKFKKNYPLATSKHISFGSSWLVFVFAKIDFNWFLIRDRNWSHLFHDFNE